MPQKPRDAGLSYVLTNGPSPGWVSLDYLEVTQRQFYKDETLKKPVSFLFLDLGLFSIFFAFTKKFNPDFSPFKTNQNRFKELK